MNEKPVHGYEEIWLDVQVLRQEDEICITVYPRSVSPHIESTFYPSA